MAKVSTSSFMNSISVARFNKYKIELKALNGREHSDAEIVAYYNANTYLCSQFYPILNMFEITLRNSIDAFMKEKYSNDWLWNEKNFTIDFCKNNSILSCKKRDKKNSNGCITTSSSCNINALVCMEHTIVPHSTIYILDAMKKRADVNHNSILSELSFGFWVNLFSKKYESCFAHKLTKVYFSGYETKDIFGKLQGIRVLRNRIFHHEAIIYKNNLNKDKNNLLELLYKLHSNAKNIVSSIVYEDVLHEMDKDIDVEKIAAKFQ